MGKYEMKGTVTEIFPTQTVGRSGFQKREFRIREESESKWANIVPFVLMKDKCSLADSIQEGAEVNIHFNISGRIWDKNDGSPTRCFCENQCWKIDILKKGKPAKQMPTVAEPPSEVDMTDDDNLPF